MVVPYNEEGYTLFSISTAEMNESISRYQSKLLFQHHTKKFYHLVDRLTRSHVARGNAYENTNYQKHSISKSPTAPSYSTRTRVTPI
ncbi:hypothetical protein TSL1_01200 [Sulfurovum sp. TSL1]|nr:hypothetical protein TSL1_01200 [Sulfurovum sp. TSL1]